jgi:hypothetical protein
LIQPVEPHRGDPGGQVRRRGDGGLGRAAGRAGRQRGQPLRQHRVPPVVPHRVHRGLQRPPRRGVPLPGVRLVTYGVSYGVSYGVYIRCLHTGYHTVFTYGVYNGVFIRCLHNGWCHPLVFWLQNNVKSANPYPRRQYHQHFLGTRYSRIHQLSS